MDETMLRSICLYKHKQGASKMQIGAWHSLTYIYVRNATSI